MDELRVDEGHVIPPAELELRTARASGPGGQGVNTTDSAVELRWDLARSHAVTADERRRLETELGTRITSDGIVIVRASDSRSQWRNRQLARARLADLVREGLRVRAPRRPTRPTRASRERRLEQKSRRAQVKRLRRPPEL